MRHLTCRIICPFDRCILENGLAPLETICPISARLIANKAAWKFRQPAIGTFCQAVAQQRAENQ